MDPKQDMPVLENFVARIEKDKGKGALTRSTIRDFCDWAVRHSVNAMSDEYLKSVSETLINLCTAIKLSENHREPSGVMANNLYLFSFELRDGLKKWITTVNEEDANRYRTSVRSTHSRLLDELKRFDELFSWTEFPEWVRQQVNASALNSGNTKSTELNTEAIRNLLTAALDDAELMALCFDHFYPVYNEKFGNGMSKAQKVQLLLDYCVRQGQLAALLGWIKQHNLHQYELHVQSIFVRPEST